jgi:putative chitinase
MKLTEEQFHRMMPNAGHRLDAHWPFVNLALERGEIDTPERIAAFMAQLAHESGEYRYMEEIWGPTEAQLGYEGRADLGNTHPGDGIRFKGHGPIQITGRANHRECGYALNLDLEMEPTLICTPGYGTASAVWFWNSRKLSPLADRRWFVAITKKINGWTNGLADRAAYWHRNRAILNLPPANMAAETDDIRAFQREQGLEADGVVGPITHAAAVLASKPNVPPADVCTPAPGWNPAQVS